MMLSIVMITVPERAKPFRRLKRKVQAQIDYCIEVHPSLGQVEIVTVNSPKFSEGGGTIGFKRQLGLKASLGAYVCWLDDDDDIAPNYVETILRLANMGADVCTFSSFCKFDSFWMVVKMHFNTKHDDGAEPGIINRRPYHVCAYRKGALEGVEFPDANIDEDTGFIEQALKKCITFAHTDAILHQYNRTVKSIACEVNA